MIKAKDKQVFEILDELEQFNNIEAKIEYIQQNYSDHTPLAYVLKWNFCDTVVTRLPEGEPPFKQEEQDGPSRASLWQYLNMFPYFVESGTSQNMPMLKIEQNFIEMLESLDITEAKMLCLAKDKNLNERWSITSEAASRSFPNMQIHTTQPVREKTPEEKAEALLEIAKRKKEEAKELQAAARQLAKQAKELLAGAE